MRVQDLLSQAPRVQQGRVLRVDATKVTVTIGGRAKTVARTGALSLKVGDRVNMQGDAIVGRRKPPPTGSTHEI